MRGRWIGGIGLTGIAGLGLVLAVVAWLAGTSASQAPEVRVVQLDERVPLPDDDLEPRPRVAPPEGPREPMTADVVQADEQERFTASATEVARHCGLVPQVACDGPHCVALAEAPDLDAASGWAEMLVSHPRFVVSTALRDLGVPPTALPCGDAIASFDAGGQGAALVERPDGSEVWCVGPPDVCDAAASTLGLDAHGFGSPDIRRLHFHRPDADGR